MKKVLLLLPIWILWLNSPLTQWGVPHAVGFYEYYSRPGTNQGCAEAREEKLKANPTGIMWCSEHNDIH